VRINAAAAGTGTSNTVTKRIVAMAISLRREEPARGRVKVDMKELLRGRLLANRTLRIVEILSPSWTRRNCFLATLA
jgi:hypothetical protein